MNIRLFTPFLVLFISLGTMAQKSTNEIILGDLKVVIADNVKYGETHRGGYNGISELRHVNQDSTLFVPLYAGFNLEHLFGGDSLVSLFEPRRHPMQLKRISESTVELYQSETPISHVESWTTFTVVAPHYIDVEFKCVIKSDEFFKHDYAGIFWASYMNAPKDKSIYFLGLENEEKHQKWIKSYSDKHGDQGNHVGVNDNLETFFAPNFNVTLANSNSDYKFVKPFYYGRFNNMVFAYLFSEPENGSIRFSQSPTGGGPLNPAWDFQLIIPNFEVGKEYSFKSRLVYKEWENQKDIKKEYRKWKDK